MIEIRNLKEEPCDLYGPDGQFIGTIETELDFSDIRLQIQEQHANGYFIRFRGKDYAINNKGVLENWPSGLFEGVCRMSAKIITGGFGKEYDLGESVKKMRGDR